MARKSESKDVPLITIDETYDPSYLALSIVPTSQPRLYELLKIRLIGDKVQSIERSEPIPFHIAVYRQKIEAASAWTSHA